MIISEFFTPNKEYRIRISRESKTFNYSDFGKYICSIELIDSIGRTILNIKSTDKGFLHLFHELGYIVVSDLYEYTDSCIYFDDNISENYFIYLARINSDSPLDDDEDYSYKDTIYCMSIFESNELYGNTLRASFNVSSIFLTNVFLDAIFKAISDLEYMNTMNKQYISDFVFSTLSDDNSRRYNHDYIRLSPIT